MITLKTMYDALYKGEFYLEYLPTISLRNLQCTGAEALIRWRRGEEIIPPGEFIPLAENTPLSGLITYWVIDTVAAELGEWLRANRAAHFSFNVPPEILGRGALEYAAAKAGLLDLAPQAIIEITERGVPDAVGISGLNNIRIGGSRIALDDVTFVGGANLAILSRSFFDILKLDRSLVSMIQPDYPIPEWLTDLAALLRSSKVVIIAEGVETELQVNVLRDSGIHAAQGFYFSRPLSAAAFIAYHGQS